MYLFTSCPYMEETPQEGLRCFDTDSATLNRRPRDMVARFCLGEFRGCPYYHIQGVPARFGGRDHILNRKKKTPVGGGIQ